MFGFVKIEFLLLFKYSIDILLYTWYNKTLDYACFSQDDEYSGLYIVLDLEQDPDL